MKWLEAALSNVALAAITALVNAGVIFAEVTWPKNIYIHPLGSVVAILVWVMMIYLSTTITKELFYKVGEGLLCELVTFLLPVFGFSYLFITLALNVR